MNVRPATPADLPALARFGAALARQHVAYDARRFVFPDGSLEASHRAFFAAQLADAAAVVLVAELPDDPSHRARVEEGRGPVVGYAFARTHDASFVDALPQSGWLHDLYVAPGARGRRVGAALLDAAVAALRAAGASVVLLTVAPANPAARRLFERRGFALTMHEMALAPDPHPGGARVA